jgi:hypothetical protein
MATKQGKIDVWLERNGHKWWFPILIGFLSLLFFPPFWIYIHYLIVVKN